MLKITHYLGSDYEAKIKTAIEQAEAQTSAEIVPMIVSTSTLARHVFPILFLGLGLISSEAYHLMPIDAFYPLTPSMVFFILVFMSALIAFVLSRFNCVKRALTSDIEEALNVERRALSEFYQAQMTSTLSKTGILLFLSLQERKAVVLADKSISDKFDKSVWEGVIQELLRGAKNESLTHGIVSAIHACAELVKKDFPRHANDKNELADKLIIKL